jgi:2-iminobutanoate/2-iminopropanoate deaminase
VVEANGFVFLSGQIGDDPLTGSVPPGGFEREARQVFENIKTLVAGVGLDLTHVVKTTVYLTDMANFQLYNALFREYFPHEPPVRATVITQLVPPYAIEIDAIAVR